MPAVSLFARCIPAMVGVKRAFAFWLLAVALALFPAGAGAAASAEPGPDVGVLPLDATAASALPPRFRTCFFPLAGPALLPEQFPPRAVIVDLRRESHGFLGDAAVSWRRPDNQGTPGRDAAFVAAAEAGLPAAIDERPDVALARQRLDFLRRFYDYARANPGGAPPGWTAWLAEGAKP